MSDEGLLMSPALETGGSASGNLRAGAGTHPARDFVERTSSGELGEETSATGAEYGAASGSSASAIPERPVVGSWLEELSLEDLRKVALRLTQQVSAVTAAIEPLKAENVRLANSLKELRQIFQEVVSAMRAFFSNPDRREWFRSQTEDPELVGFFQRLIVWYRKVAKNDKEPMMTFYRKIWEYERGDTEDQHLGGDPQLEEACRAANDATGVNLGSSSLGSSAPSAVDPESRVMGSRGNQRGTKTNRRLTSQRLYDACHARTESMILLEENRRMRGDISSLQRLVDALEGQVRALSTSIASSTAGAGAGTLAAAALGSASASAASAVMLNGATEQSGSAPGPISFEHLAAADDFEVENVIAIGGAVASSSSAASAAPRRTSKTLGRLATTEPRWRRLLDDPDGLFVESDVIEDTYEQYLSEVVDVMVQQGCSFKRGVELCAAATTDKDAQVSIPSTLPADSGVSSAVADVLGFEEGNLSIDASCNDGIQDRPTSEAAT